MALQFMHRLHMPETYPALAALLAPDVLQTWLHYSPNATPVHRDWEDWAENAIMLHECHKASGGKVRILETEKNIHFSGDRTSYVAANPGAPRGFMYGMWKPHDSVSFPNDVDIIGNNAEVVRAVAGYGKSDIFLKAASRAFYVVDADYDQIETILLRLHRAGQRKVFIKTRFKEAAELFTLPDEPAHLWGTITAGSSLEWFLMQYEGMKDALFIQEAFEPTKEYRMIIVGDRPITGAGCVENFTPIDNTGSDFDPRVENIRNVSSPVVDHETVQRYISFAEEFARDWACQNGDQMIYSLDLAIDARTGQVVAIELNPMTNLGLYASKASKLVNSVVEKFG